MSALPRRSARRHASTLALDAYRANPKPVDVSTLRKAVKQSLDETKRKGILASTDHGKSGTKKKVPLLPRAKSTTSVRSSPDIDSATPPEDYTISSSSSSSKPKVPIVGVAADIDENHYRLECSYRPLRERELYQRSQPEELPLEDDIRRLVAKGSAEKSWHWVAGFFIADGCIGVKKPTLTQARTQLQLCSRLTEHTSTCPDQIVDAFSLVSQRVIVEHYIQFTQRRRQPLHELSKILGTGRIFYRPEVKADEATGKLQKNGYFRLEVTSQAEIAELCMRLFPLASFRQQQILLYFRYMIRYARMKEHKGSDDPEVERRSIWRWNRFACRHVQRMSFAKRLSDDNKDDKRASEEVVVDDSSEPEHGDPPLDLSPIESDDEEGDQLYRDVYLHGVGARPSLTMASNDVGGKVSIQDVEFRNIDSDSEEETDDNFFDS